MQYSSGGPAAQACDVLRPQGEQYASAEGSVTIEMPAGTADEFEPPCPERSGLPCHWLFGPSRFAWFNAGPLLTGDRYDLVNGLLESACEPRPNEPSLPWTLGQSLAQASRFTAPMWWRSSRTTQTLGDWLRIRSRPRHRRGSCRGGRCTSPGCGEMVRAPTGISTSQIRAFGKSTYRYAVLNRRTLGAFP